MGIRAMSWNPQHYPRGRGQVSLSVSDRLAVVTFDNPGAKNAMSVGMMADVVRIINELEQADVSVVLLRGAPGGGFCSGGDLKDVTVIPMAPGDTLQAKVEALQQLCGNLFSALLVPVAERAADVDLRPVGPGGPGIHGDTVILGLIAMGALGFFSSFDARSNLVMRDIGTYEYDAVAAIGLLASLPLGFQRVPVQSD